MLFFVIVVVFYFFCVEIESSNEALARLFDDGRHEMRVEGKLSYSCFNDPSQSTLIDRAW